MRGYGWFGNGGCSLWGGYGNFGLWNVLIFAGLVIITIALVLLMFKRRNSGDTGALDKLKILYVNGEITEEEYLKRKEVIERK